MQVVGRDNQSAWRLRLFDICGGALCAALVAVAGWLAFVHVGEAAQEVAALREQVESTRQTLTTVESAAIRQESLATARKAELGDRGKLPAAAPIDQYLSAMSAAAAAHNLTVIGHSPSAQRRYGDVFEQCISFQVQGSSANLLRFMRAVEDSPFWADIGYLRIEGGDSVGPPNSNLRRAALTFSLFAAAAVTPAPNTSAEVKP